MSKIISFLLLAALASANVVRATEADSDKKAKTLEKPVEFKSAEAYESAAKARISNFKLPEGVSASLFADSSQIQNPSAICFDDLGRLYVAEIHRWRAGVQDIRNEQQILLDDINNETNADRLAMYQNDKTRPLSFYEEFEDRIVRLEDTDDDGRADQSVVWADGFNDALDGPGIGLVAGRDHEIYYTNIPHLWKLTDTDGDGKAEKRESLQDGFGVRMSISGHDMHGVIWGPDGKLYWSIGDRGYSVTTKEGRHFHRPYEGGVFRCDPDGSNLEEIYRGLRNPQELAFDQFGNLFTCDNDADQWDKGRLVYIIEGGDSGWNHGHQVLLNFRKKLELRTPDYQHPGRSKIPMNPWMTEGLWETWHPERPAHALPPIEIVSWGPSGLVYNYGAVAMPARYDNHFWICNFGGAKGDLEAFSVKNKGAGFALDHKEKFMEGLGNTDVEFGPDGRMYLSCFNNNGWTKQDIGNIYVLESEDPKNSDLIRETEALLVKPFRNFVESELDVLLGHADMRVRQRAQFDLVRRNSVALLTAATEQTENRLKRLHGLWGIGQLARSDQSLLRLPTKLLSDADDEIRAQAAKVLADSRASSVGGALTTALDDPSARVRAFAAIGVGKCGAVNALTKLLDILATNNNEDVFLRHACVEGLWGLNEREKILKEVDHESAAVRLGVLLTLRRLEDPRVKYFLADDDPFIYREAIRAISDLDLITALPDLADEILTFATPTETTELPSDHRDWIIQTRLINANFRAGGSENAANLLTYAAQPKLPAMLREQALKALLEWKKPRPVDATNGFYRPLDPASRADIGDAVESGVPAVFENAEGNLLSLAAELAGNYGVAVPTLLLTRQIMDPAAEIEARIGSLDELAKENPAAIIDAADNLLAAKDPAFKAAVVSNLITIDPPRGVSEAVKLADSEEVALRQRGYRLLAKAGTSEAASVIENRLTMIKSELPGALLDLLEAGEMLRNQGKIATLLDAYQGSLDPADPMSAFTPALAGGDIESGRELFLTHAAGQCAKCHIVDGDGGVAGPDLTGIASRHDARYLLESLVAPSAEVVSGYGMTMVTLKNGETIGGTLASESDTEVVLKQPDPQNSDKQIEKTISADVIESRLPPVSAMPPMGALMSKGELRDLVAYLASLNEKNAKKGH